MSAPLEIGNFVRVTGTAEKDDFIGEAGLIADDYEDGDFHVYLFGPTEAFKFTPAELTPITREEALA